MSQAVRPALAKPSETTGRGLVLDAVRSAAGSNFDADVFHVIDQRDNSLIADELMNGAGSSKFVYQFDIMGTKVTGISVVGARHLAAHYGGIKHRIVGSIQKTGSLFVFKSYPAPGQPMSVSVQSIPELGAEPDFFEALVEITDIKTGNTIQVEKREMRLERKRDGSYFERPHYAIIAQSKAYRNGVLDLIPQDVQIKWKEEQLKLGKEVIITASVRDEKLAAIVQFAAAKAIPLERRMVEELTMDQINGLREAAKEGQPAFVNSAISLGLILALEDTAASKPEPSQAKPAARGKSTQSSSEPPPTDPNDPGPQMDRRQGEPPHDPETGEIKSKQGERPAPAPSTKSGGFF